MKRLLCLMLAMVLMFGLLGVQTLAVEEKTQGTEPQTEETEPTVFKASKECVGLIKQYEGFAKYPMWDYSQYSVGYGTRCPDDKLAYYRQHGITEAEAEALLCDFLKDFEDEINYRLIQKYGLKLNQNQFDALLSFSYNCGTGWMYDQSGTMFNAITTGATGTELIRSFSLWCSAGGQVLHALMQRRLAEANLYLNGVYSRTPPENYCYVTFNGNGGTITPRAQGFDSNYPASPRCTATYIGYTFNGWYTDRVGGEKVTSLDASLNRAILYAQWVDGDGHSSNVETVNVDVTVTGTNVNVRSGPGTGYTKVSTVTKGDKLNITQVTTAGGYTWGKFTKGWVALQYTNYDAVVNQQPEETPTEPTTPEPTEPVEPETTVPTEPETTAPTEPAPTEPEPTEPEATKVYGTVQVENTLNVRSGPGTGYARVGTLKNGARVEILEQKTVGSVTWGKISSGWISLQYVKLDGSNTTENNSGTTTTVVGTGTVVNCTQLRIRSGPGTNYDHVGYLAKGTKVSFTEYKTVGSVKWGKMSKGWVSLDYIQMDGTSTGGTTTGGNTSTGTATTLTGVVIANDFLRIRTGPGTSYAVAGYLKPNDKVTITEQKTVSGVKWGKISSGWISLQYVKLDSTTGGGSADSGSNNSGSTGTTTTTSVTGVVTGDYVNVRSGAGTSYSKVGQLSKGQKVTITETKTVNGVKWGKISSGWVSMDYIKIEDNTTSTTEDVRTVNATSLYVRSTPGTNGTIVGYLYNGAKVTILEIKTVDGRQWGRITNGWICLEYTKK